MKPALRSSPVLNNTSGLYHGFVLIVACRKIGGRHHRRVIKWRVDVKRPSSLFSVSDADNDVMTKSRIRRMTR